jgi:hypothetical protein
MNVTWHLTPKGVGDKLAGGAPRRRPVATRGLGAP